MKDVRELSYTPGRLSFSSGHGPESPDRPQDHRRDEEASSRMDDEGCPNERTATLPDATGYSRIGGRLLLVGSPIF